MQDTITLEIESDGQITSHELPVEERDGRKVVRLVVVVRGGGGGGQAYVSGYGPGPIGETTRGGGDGGGYAAGTTGPKVWVTMSRGGPGGSETNR